MAAPAPARTDFIFQAEQAVNYVKSKMTVGAENKLGDVIRSLGNSFLCVLAERHVNEEDSPATVEAWIVRTAAIAESAGCGNCGEQAAVAFIYLRDRGVHPVEYAHFVNHDHAFVVLNRSKDSDESKPSTWGNDSIVCDPWKGRAYKAAELNVVWPGATVEVMFRIN
jgi:hypothetical protein